MKLKRLNFILYVFFSFFFKLSNEVYYYLLSV